MIDKYFTYITDDRRLYKPNEEVHISGWIRLIKNNNNNYVVHEFPNNLSYLLFNAKDSKGNEFYNGKS